MVFKAYHYQILIRLVLLIATSAALVYSWQLTGYWFLRWNLLLLLLIQVYMFMRFITHWQRDLKVFAESVRHNDYSITFQRNNQKDAYSELYAMLNGVGQYVRTVKSDLEKQNQYLQYVVENSRVAMVAFDERREILFCNQEFLKIAGVSRLTMFDEILGTNPTLHASLQQLKINHAHLITIRNKETLKLSARLSVFVMEGRPIKLITLLNIRSELEQNELQSWQDLISVLTHEIMNSITPIHSLSGSMVKYIDKIEGNEEIVTKTRSSLEVIQRRSQSLMSFVNRYRMISTVPLPHLEEVKVSQLVQEVLVLLQEELKGIAVTFDHHNEVIKADASQIEQVLINIIRNAIFAMEQSVTKKIGIHIIVYKDATAIDITDTGKGISSDVADKIFIPFFTTRKEGSGIGLTLSRQIMQRHGGTIEVNSDGVQGATFRLLLKSE
jgi:nitrogen fixation/metabolism regulation signal transduction histidine kinase